MLSKASSRETWLLAGSSLKSLATAIFVIKTCMFHCNVSLAKMYHVKDCSVEPDMFVTLKRVAYIPFYLFKRQLTLHIHLAINHLIRISLSSNISLFSVGHTFMLLSATLGFTRISSPLKGSFTTTFTRTAMSGWRQFRGSTLVDVLVDYV